MPNMIEEKKIKLRVFSDIIFGSLRQLQNNEFVKRVDPTINIKIYAMNKEKTNIRIDLINMDNDFF